MKLDLVGYRFKIEQLQKLASVLGYGSIRALDLGADASGEVSNSSHTLTLYEGEDGLGHGLDAVTALLVRSLCSAYQYIIILRQSERLVLINAQKLCLMVQQRQNDVILKPARSADELLEELQDLFGESNIQYEITREGGCSLCEGDVPAIIEQLRSL